MATVESVGSSTRIEGAKLSDAEVEDLLLRAISMRSFKSRDEPDVTGYAEAMDLVFEAYADMRLTESHFHQLHRTVLRHSDKDAHHRGSYKTLSNDSWRSARAGARSASSSKLPRRSTRRVRWRRSSLDAQDAG